jgi:3-oxoacyl-[acyl-carrier protein] reductase
MSGRTVLVTGGARGIGRAIVERFLACGDRVWFNDMSQEVIDETMAELGENAVGRFCNVTDFEAVKNLIKEIVQVDGRLDVLVNNAGITRDGLIMRMSEDQWDSVLDVNLKGVFNVIRHTVKPMMKQRSGSIINISSVVALSGNAGQVNYTASKAGVIGMTRTLAQELSSRNIRVNAVAPGFIETKMTAQLSDEERAKLCVNIPLGRTGQPVDIANMCHFLASDDAAYVTGQVMNVDGGLRM